jgi:hypothetical protein
MALSPTLNDMDAKDRSLQLITQYGELMLWCDLMEQQAQESLLPSRDDVRNTFYQS